MQCMYSGAPVLSATYLSGHSLSDRGLHSDPGESRRHSCLDPAQQCGPEKNLPSGAEN